MNLSQLKPPKGAVRKPKRIGRGNAAGQGGTSGKGHKGAKARSGTERGPSFEGGQMPLLRRIPKRGFNNRFRKEYAIVNLRDLTRFEAGQVVDAATLLKWGVISHLRDGLKVLSEGEPPRELTVKAHKFSAKAALKIVAAGGRAEVVKERAKMVRKRVKVVKG